jgi:mannose-6-phosphate isomerase-like protein (cupin superfamily)
MNVPSEVRRVLGGKVAVQKLLVTDQPQNRAEVLARLLSPKGEFVVLCDGALEIRHLGCLELRPDVARGNHFHKLRNERFYLIAGELDLAVEDSQTGQKEIATLRAGEMAFIPPFVAHVFLPRIPGLALEFAAETFDPADVYPFDVEARCQSSK